MLFQSTKVQFITVNVRPTLKDGSKNVLADPKVRQALNYAIDKNALAKVVTFDVGNADGLVHVVRRRRWSTTTARSIPMISKRPRLCSRRPASPKAPR